MTIKQAIAAWEATGRTAFHYPRLKMVSLNGFKRISEKEAVAKIQEFLKNAR